MTIAVFLVSLLGAMALGVPIAYALLVCGVALMVFMGNFDAQILAQNLVEGANTFPLLAVPFFMLAGEVMNVGGLSKRIVNLALALVGHLRGGLGYVVILAAVMMAALSGSAVADTAALAALLLPMMVAAGHNRASAGGLIASAWFFVAKREKITPPPRATAAQRWKALREATWALVLPLIVLVGLKMGVFTPTEAAVVAAVYALFVATVVYRELKLGQLYQVFVSAAKVSAAIMFLVAAAMVSAWLITVANLPQELIALLQPLIDRPMLLMFVMMLIVIAVGTAMDMTPTILILTPVLMPLVKAGMDKLPGLPLPATVLRPGLWVSEIVYFPLDTELLQAARRAGCRVVDGGTMAVGQAIGAFELFTGLAADTARMDAHFRRLIKERA